MSPPGSVRSARQKYGWPGVARTGPHQAWSINATAAPTARPAWMPSPVLVSAPRVHDVLAGDGRYCVRMARLCSNPPAAMMTPPLALTSDETPLTVATTPLTVPLAMLRLSIGVLSQTGTPALSRPARRPAADAWPMVSG